MPPVLPGNLIIDEQYVRVGTLPPYRVRSPMTFTGFLSGLASFDGAVYVNPAYEEFYKAGDPDIPQVVPAAATGRRSTRKHRKSKRKNSRSRRRNNNTNQHGI